MGFLDWLIGDTGGAAAAVYDGPGPVAKGEAIYDGPGPVANGAAVYER